MTIKEKLIEARALIADIEHWTQGDAAVCNTGMGTDPISDDACAWCADGAIVKSCYGFDNKTWDECSLALRNATHAIFPDFVPDTKFNYVALNDAEYEAINTYEGCHAAILRVFDYAIANA